MKYSLHIEVTGKAPEQIHFCTEQSYPAAWEACGLKGTITKEETYGLPEYTIRFVPEKEVVLHTISLRMYRKDAKMQEEYPVYVYDNGYITNTFAQILKWEKESSEQIDTRDLITMHNAKGDLNAAFTTFERFYTEFHTDPTGIRAVYFMEDKPVQQGEAYVLETLVIDESLEGLAFFEQYTQLLHDKYQIGPMKPIPAGWSSWSCLYGAVTEQDVLTQADMLEKKWRDLGADLIQIDDSWQEEGSFSGTWKTRLDKFGHDMKWLTEECNRRGIKMGLWMAPGMLTDKSASFEEKSAWLNRENGELIPYMGVPGHYSYGYDITREDVIEFVKDMFRRGVEEYGAVYFKVDMITNLLIRTGNGFHKDSRVQYPIGYAVENYKRFMKEIRNTVGKDVFLLACSSPIGEAIGIYDGIRVSHDIAWGPGLKEYPGAWGLICKDAQCAVLRSPYHNKVFINDPDALLVRDYFTPHANDGVALGYEEAKMWATTVAMSGGHILINEEIDKLSEERQELFTNILPPLGLAARPVDFYEYPWCSEVYIAVDKDTQITALYNWGEGELKKTVKNPFDSKAVLVDCWSHEIIGCLEESMEFILSAHTCRAMLVKRLPKAGGYLYSDGNFYLGAGGNARGTSYYYFPEGAPVGYEAAEHEKLQYLYIG